MTASATTEAIIGMFTRGCPSNSTATERFTAATLGGRPSATRQAHAQPPRKNICTT
jgi:hypothetical protein